MSLDKIYVALDSMTKEEIENFLSISGGKIKNIKIGLELFLKYGPSIVLDLYEHFHSNIFLDLKLHDIPATVEKAIASLHGLPITFLTIHLSGGRSMCEYAYRSASQYLPQTKLLGVSYLTSLETNDTNELFGFNLNQQQFQKLFQIAYETKIHGVVCSPHEVSLVKGLSKTIITMTPGVRFSSEITKGDNLGDQKRILSVEDALKNGSNFLVMGRSLTQDKDPVGLNKKLHYLDSL